MATQGLATFRPGYRVATASSLSDARDWLVTLQPSLIVISTSVGSGNDRSGLVADAGLTPQETILITDRLDAKEDLFDAGSVLVEPVRLDELLTAARAVAGRLATT
jgi:DNA-binding response OmpR family regulator